MYLVLNMGADHQRSVFSYEQEIQLGDVILVKIGADELVSIEEKLGLALKAVKKFGENVQKNGSTLTDESSKIFQAVVAPVRLFLGVHMSGDKVELPKE